MAAKIVLALCASVLCIQSILTQNCGCNDLGNLGQTYGYGNNQYLNLGSNSLGYNYNNGLSSSTSSIGSGGSFPVTSVSPITASGISVVSENTIEGPLTICGNLPLLAVVSLEGQVPTTGQAAVQYGCGDGNIGITETAGSYASGAGSYASGAGSYGSGSYAVNSCGCNY